VTGKDSKNKEVFKETKTYMPVPHQLGRGDKMGRGPYDKSGILRETSLAPGKQMHENFTVPFPSGETEMTVTVELWYLPFGTKADPDNAFLWRKETKKVGLEKGGV
jgi:hypothetical protein